MFGKIVYESENKLTQPTGDRRTGCLQSYSTSRDKWLTLRLPVSFMPVYFFF